MGKIREFLAGKKTYIVAFGIAAVVMVRAFGIEIPEEVWGVLAAFGLAAVRAAVGKVDGGGEESK